MILQIFVLGTLLAMCLTFIVILMIVTVVLIALLYMALRIQTMN